MKKFINKNNLILHVKETPNNTILTFTDNIGNCILWQTNGSSKFKGLRKSTAVANNTSGILIGNRIKNLNIKQFEIQFNG